jgi:hypothetical protein
MNTKTSLFKLLYLLILLAGTVTAEAQSAAKQKLIATQKMRFNALTARDTSELSRLLADDLVYVNTNGVMDNKSSFLKSIATGAIVYLFILPEKSIATIEGNFGWVYGKANIRFRVASINMTIDQYISFIDFYRLTHDQWELVACQNARVNPDNPYFIKPQEPQVKKSVQPLIY